MQGLHLFTHRFAAMGSPCEIQLYALDAVAADNIARQAIADVQRLEQRYSRYRPDSFLSAINRIAKAGGSIEIDAETAGLLDYADTCFRESDGLFDITSGILRRVWYRDRTTLPTEEEIAPLLAQIGWQKIRRRQASQLTFPPGMEIDFGGIVKEYAADRVATLCWNAGAQHGVINLGGDIRVIGPHPDGSPWRIGIQHPREKQSSVGEVVLHRGAIATSGDYERCILIDGKRYGHVLNPKTGWPIQHMASVSVIGDFCVVAGSASTIAMLMETEGARWLDSLGLPHAWVDMAGNTGGLLNVIH